MELQPVPRTEAAAVQLQLAAELDGEPLQGRASTDEPREEVEGGVHAQAVPPRAHCAAWQESLCGWWIPERVLGDNKEREDNQLELIRQMVGFNSFTGGLPHFFHQSMKVDLNWVLHIF